jgi:hypothetical protein
MRHAYADLVRALLHRVRHQSVHPDRRQKQSDDAKDPKEHRAQSLAVDRQRRVQGSELGTHGRQHGQRVAVHLRQ